MWGFGFDVWVRIIVRLVQVLCIILIQTQAATIGNLDIVLANVMIAVNGVIMALNVISFTISFQIY